MISHLHELRIFGRGQDGEQRRDLLRRHLLADQQRVCEVLRRPAEPRESDRRVVRRLRVDEIDDLGLSGCARHGAPFLVGGMLFPGSFLVVLPGSIPLARVRGEVRLELLHVEL